MANIACGNARLGHGHALSLPMEGHLDLPHPYGVGILLPHVLAFDLAVLPDKVRPLAEALDVDTAGLSRTECIEAAAEAVRDLYRDIAFPLAFTPEQLPRDRVAEMARRAVPGLYAGIAARDYDPATARPDTIIACPSARKMTVAQAEAMLTECCA